MPDEEGKGRVANPNSSTPASFTSLNWDHAENCTSTPQPDSLSCTFMGPAATTKAGLGKEWPDDNVCSLKTAIGELRELGYTFEVPEEWKEGEGKSDWSKQKLELDYYKESYYSEMEIQKDGIVHMVVSRVSDWLVVTCRSAAASAVVEKQLNVHHNLTRVDHEETTVFLSDGLKLTVRTGNSTGNAYRCPGTMFELQKFDKIIAKCLCSYHNSEMDNSGPTIELLETAVEWRRHGYGERLLKEVRRHFEETLGFPSGTKFNVCYVTNGAACRWFLSRGFDDWDSMGEELGTIF